MQKAKHFPECLNLLAKAEEIKALVEQLEKGSSLPKESPSHHHGMVKRNLSDLKRTTCVVSSVSRHFKRCQMWLWFLCFSLCSTFAMCCSFLPFALGFMPFCRISPAFLFLGFYAHLKLLVHFRASCYIIKTEKVSHSSKNTMERGTRDSISWAVMCLWSERRVGFF